MSRTLRSRHVLRHSHNVRLLPKHALTIVLVFTVSVELCPNAHAQQTTTYNDEAEWKTAYLSAQATGAAATNKRIVGGVFLAGAGLLTALAALHTTTTPPFRCFVPPCSMPSRDATTERHLQAGLLTAGIGAGVTGFERLSSVISITNLWRTSREPHDQICLYRFM